MTARCERSSMVLSPAGALVALLVTLRNVLEKIGLYPPMQKCFLYAMVLVRDFQVISIKEKHRDYCRKVNCSSSFQRYFASKSHCKHRKTNVVDGKGFLDHHRLDLVENMSMKRRFHSQSVDPPRLTALVRFNASISCCA